MAASPMLSGAPIFLTPNPNVGECVLSTFRLQIFADVRTVRGSLEPYSKHTKRRRLRRI
jgi:hypothetical protein